MVDGVRHMAPMNLGSDRYFGTGATIAMCGVKISDGSGIPHSNLALHTTCLDCLAVCAFEPPDLSSPTAVEEWLAT
jgi:hypothetical protein